MNNNKVIYGNETIMDISDSTTTSGNLLQGEVGYSGNGDRVVGSATAGHKVVNDAGTTLTQRDKLQFKGVYVEDNQAGDVTKVDIVREFSTVAEIEALTGEAKKGFEVIEDNEEYIPYTGSDILFDNTDTSFEGENVQEVLEEVDGVLRELGNEETYSITQPFTPPFTATYLLKRYGKIINFCIEGIWFNGITGNSAKIIGTIPSSIKPTNNPASAVAIINSNGDVVGNGRVFVNKNTGDITVVCPTTISGNLGIQANFTWIL